MTSKVFVALRVKATPERAFAAFVGEIGQWWKPSSLFQTTPRAPGLLAFEPGEGGRLTETLA
ncbi:MAG TPA: ATPase, partial [Phenylobacterium sp.]